MIEDVVTYLIDKNEFKTVNILLKTMQNHAKTVSELDVLGKLFYASKNYAGAIDVTLIALSMSTTDAEKSACYSNLSKLYNIINDPQSALHYVDLNKLLIGETANIKLETAYSLFLLNCTTSGEKILREMDDYFYESEDMRNRIKFNLGVYDLRNGDFQAGLRNIILVGREIGISAKTSAMHNQWTGGKILTPKLIILGEGGIGDEFINFRFCETIKTQHQCEVIWCTSGRKDLSDIFSRLGVKTYSSVHEIVENENDCDLSWVNSMSLPIYLNCKECALWTGNYLYANDIYVKKHEHLFGNNGKIKVGVRWAGNINYEQNLHRSINPKDIMNVVNEFKDSMDIYSFQRDDYLDVLYDYEFDSVIPLHDYMETYEDTMGMLSKIDLLLTSCTSLAHCAAAMGIRTCVFVPIASYYVWNTTINGACAWYGDNLTIFRQTMIKSWDAPMAELRSYLQLHDFILN